MTDAPEMIAVDARWAFEHDPADDTILWFLNGEYHPHGPRAKDVARRLAAIRRKAFEEAAKANDDMFTAYDKCGRDDRYAVGYANACRDFKTAIRALSEK